MDYLITGGNGFIGSNFISYLLGREPDANVVNLDLNNDPRSESAMELQQFGDRYSILEGDVTDLSTYEDYLKVSDVVIHCAFENNKVTFNERMERCVHTNIFGTRVISEATVKHGIPLILISTDEVYGSCRMNTPRREETAIPDPTNVYAATMAAGERLAMLSRRRSDVPLIILRACELIGPNQSDNWPVPSAIRDILIGKPPNARGKKERRFRDWIHVLDLCSAMEFVVKGLMGKGINPAPPDDFIEKVNPGKTLISGTSVATLPTIHSPPSIRGSNLVLAGDVIIFNVTAEMRHPISEVIEKVVSLMDSDLPLQESPENIHRDIGYNPSSKKLKYHGWKHRYTDIDEVLRSTIDWYRSHLELHNIGVSNKLNP